MITIDRLDAHVLGWLTANARTGIAELASQLGVARNTVQARLARLTESGVIMGYAARIDLEAAGVPVQAYVGLELDQRRLGHVVEALQELPQVLEINTLAGREDLLVRVGATSLADLQEIATAIIDIDGVRHSTTTPIVSTPLRMRTQPLLDHLTRGAGYGRSDATRNR